MDKMSCIEICAGAGGQALELEGAWFEPEALIEIDARCCNILRYNRPNWNVVEADLNVFDGSHHLQIDFLAGGGVCTLPIIF